MFTLAEIGAARQPQRSLWRVQVEANRVPEFLFETLAPENLERLQAIHLEPLFALGPRHRVRGHAGRFALRMAGGPQGISLRSLRNVHAFLELRPLVCLQIENRYRPGNGLPTPSGFQQGETVAPAVIALTAEPNT